MIALDVRKAFDTVDHASLLRKLHHEGLDVNTQSVIKQNLETQQCIRLAGSFGDKLCVKQGVGQGKILSAQCYKTYIDHLLSELQESNLGMFIGSIYVGTIFCADDAFLVADEMPTLQAQADIVTDYASRERYDIHPAKSQPMALGTSEPVGLDLGGNELSTVDRVTHLGVARGRDRKGDICLDDMLIERSSSASSTVYAMIGAGMHGANGLPPQSR